MSEVSAPVGLTATQQRQKRALDLVLAGAGLLATSPLLVCGVIAATISTRQWGVFSQERIGRQGQPFRLYKVRSMRRIPGQESTVTAAKDPRITRTGEVLRALKIDELPQLVNVLRGDMSIVGPRPDVPGWANILSGHDRVILTVRPGITGPASIAFRHEEELLAHRPDPEVYNREVIWPQKVRINRQYVMTWSMRGDLQWVAKTFRAVGIHR